MYDLITIGTLPRGLTHFLFQLLGNDLKNPTFFRDGLYTTEGVRLMQVAMLEVERHYPALTYFPPKTKDAARIGLLYAITRLPVRTEHQEMLAKLEKETLLLLQSNQDKWRCEMPPCFVQTVTRKSPNLLQDFPDILTYLDMAPGAL